MPNGFFRRVTKEINTGNTYTDMTQQGTTNPMGSIQPGEKFNKIDYQELLFKMLHTDDKPDMDMIFSGTSQTLGTAITFETAIEVGDTVDGDNLTVTTIKGAKPLAWFNVTVDGNLFVEENPTVIDGKQETYPLIGNTYTSPTGADIIFKGTINDNKYQTEVEKALSFRNRIWYGCTTYSKEDFEDLAVSTIDPNTGYQGITSDLLQAIGLNWVLLVKQEDEWYLKFEPNEQYMYMLLPKDAVTKELESVLWINEFNQKAVEVLNTYKKFEINIQNANGIETPYICYVSAQCLKADFGQVFRINVP